MKSRSPGPVTLLRNQNARGLQYVVAVLEKKEIIAGKSSLHALEQL
jgi:hypothetical protein